MIFVKRNISWPEIAKIMCTFHAIFTHKFSYSTAIIQLWVTIGERKIYIIWTAYSKKKLSWKLNLFRLLNKVKKKNPFNLLEFEKQGRKMILF